MSRQQLPALVVRHLGEVPYQPVWEAMQAFTQQRGPDTADEIWLLQHQPVYTLGLKAGTAPAPPGDIPVVKTDRGGDITYHGPGQLVAYLLMDLPRLGLGVRHLVSAMEQGTIGLLERCGIEGRVRSGAPGVYVGERKIASLGLRVRRGCSYHGISLNVDMDLTPFGLIAPCGYRGLRMTQLAEWGLRDMAFIETELLGRLCPHLGYNPDLAEHRHQAGAPCV